MIWQIDNATQIAALSFPFTIYANAALPQDQGGNFDPSSWISKIRPTDTFPPPPLRCSPSQIIAEFQAQHYLQALAFTICWGGMWRTNQDIYRQHQLQHILDDQMGKLGRKDHVVRDISVCCLAIEHFVLFAVVHVDAFQVEPLLLFR